MRFLVFIPILLMSIIGVSAPVEIIPEELDFDQTLSAGDELLISDNGGKIVYLENGGKVVVMSANAIKRELRPEDQSPILINSGMQDIFIVTSQETIAKLGLPQDTKFMIFNQKLVLVVETFKGRFKFKRASMKKSFVIDSFEKDSGGRDKRTYPAYSKNANGADSCGKNVASGKRLAKTIT